MSCKSKVKKVTLFLTNNSQHFCEAYVNKATISEFTEHFLSKVTIQHATQHT